MHLSFHKRVTESALPSAKENPMQLSHFAKITTLLLLSITVLPGARGCGGTDNTGTSDPSICTNDAACPEAHSCINNECVADEVESSTEGMACGGNSERTCDEGQICNISENNVCGVDNLSGICVVPSEICTREYNPQCGCDGVTYSNPCMRKIGNTPLQYPGACGTSTESERCSATGVKCDAGFICEGQLIFEDEQEVQLNSCTDYPGGNCVPAPNASCPDTQNKVCGCDGQTFLNDCMRRAAQVPLAYVGECQ